MKVKVINVCTVLPSVHRMEDATQKSSCPEIICTQEEFWSHP